MNGPIQIKRATPGYRVLKHGQQVATIRRSKAGELGHNTAEPWLLEYSSGRIERYGDKSEAVDAAHKV